MVLASHEAYAWLENQVHGVERVTLGVQPQRPRESVPVLRSEQVTVFSGLTGVGNSEMNRPSHPLPVFISKPHAQAVEGPERPSGAACVNALREQCPPADTVRTDLCGLPGSQGCLPVAVGLLAGPLCP